MIPFDYTWTGRQMASYLAVPEPKWDGMFKDPVRLRHCVEGFEGEEKNRVSSLIQHYWEGKLSTADFIERFEQGLWPAGRPPEPRPEPDDAPWTYYTGRDGELLRFRTAADAVSWAHDRGYNNIERDALLATARDTVEPRPGSAAALKLDLKEVERRLDELEPSRIPSRTRLNLEDAASELRTRLAQWELTTARPSPETPVYLYRNSNGTLGFVAQEKVRVQRQHDGDVFFDLYNGQTLQKSEFLGVTSRTLALDLINAKE